MNLTIMSYNIERGFHSRDHTLERQRLEAAQRAVKSVNPDLLALTEACYGGPNSQNIVMDYAELFGFPYSHFGAFPKFGPRRGDEGGNCLLSRIPMQAETVQLVHKSAVRARISLEDKILTIDVIHPSPSVTDAKKITTHSPLISSREAPYILTGDFNTVHPEDQYNFRKLERDIRAYDPEKAGLIINNWKRAEFIRWLLQQGLQDAFPKRDRQSTVPTSYAYEGKKEGVRMDFFFISGNIEVKETSVLKNSDTEIASDHYPIVGVFEI